MVCLILLFCSLYVFPGCIPSKADQSTQTQEIYVQPASITPIHQSVLRVRATSASFSDSDEENEFPISLRRTITRINRHYEAKESKEGQDARALELSIRAARRQPVRLDLD